MEQLLIVHEYSYNSDERRQWTVWLYRFSLAIITVLNIGIALLHDLNNVLLVFQAPTTVFVFGFIHRQFETRLWQRKWLRRLGVVSVPDLSGHWKGHVISSFMNEPGNTAEESIRRKIDVTITQTWNQISIKLKTDESTSVSESASIICNGSKDCVLHYQYRNEPEPLVVSTMDRHRGTVLLNISTNELNGRYYTDRKIPTEGKMYLKRA